MDYYQKHPTSVEEQIALLKSRGLAFRDEARARSRLSNIGYYRMSAYWYTFLAAPKKAHIFKPGFDFEDVIKTYVFDRKLRVLVFDEIERIEVAFRAKLVDTFSLAYGANWYEKQNLYLSPPAKHFENKPDALNYCDGFLKCVDEDFAGSKEEFAKAYRLNYRPSERPPSWIAFQVLSITQISKLYKNLKSCPEKTAIAKHFALDADVLASWLEALSFVRNVCAHHCRLWNRYLPAKPIFPSHPLAPWLNAVPGPLFENRVYTALVMVRYLLSQIIPDTEFTSRIAGLMEKYPNIPTQRMGFTPNWQQEPLWVGK